MSPPLVLVSVGSDHHPFQRLVDWSDDFARRHPEVRVVVQFGHATPPRNADGSSFYAHGDFQKLMSQATAIVVQGGPAGIFEARGHGVLPIVVPRRRAEGEHVDDHQRSFARFVDRSGRAVMVEHAEAFHASLERALVDPTSHRIDPSSDGLEIADTVRNFTTIIDDLVAGIRVSSRRRKDGP